MGVFRSDDGGATWAARNEGVTQILPDRERNDIGFCVHGLARSPNDPDRIYRQDHTGVYRTTGGDVFASADGGASWQALVTVLQSVSGG